MREVAVELTAEAAGPLELRARHEYLAITHVVKAARVVGVEVGEHDGADVRRAHADPIELRPKLLVRAHVAADGAAEVRVPAREVAGLARARRLAGVDEDRAVVVLDQPCVDRQRLGPVAVEGRAQAADHPGSGASELLRADLDRAGLDGVDAHRASVWHSPWRGLPARAARAVLAPPRALR